MKPGYVLKTSLFDYQKAWDLQVALHERRRTRAIPDTLILTEHPHTYTIGKAGGESNLVASESVLRERGITVYRIDRGGDITYHGPGQIVGYPILDLHDHYLDVHRYLRDVEEVLIRTLGDYGIVAGREPGLTGVWADGAKIAAIGVKVSRWVTMHGFAFNVNTDLSYFGNIIPCGITDKPVTSMQQLLNRKLDMAEVGERVVEKFSDVFNLRFEERAQQELLENERVEA